MSSALKKRVLVFGNCQGQWLAETLSRQPVIAAEFEIIYLANFGVRPESHPIQEPGFVATCDVVIWQTASGSEPPDFLASLNPQCRQFRFPTLWLKLLWPLHATDHRSQAEPGFPYGRYPYGDRLASKLINEGVPIAELTSRYLETDLNKIINLDRFAEMAWAELRYIDQQSDVCMSPDIESNFTRKKLFGCLNHPTFGLLWKIFHEVERALLNTTTPAPVRNDENAAEIFGEIEIPLHPQVITHFQLAWAAPEMRYRYNSAFLTHDEYLQAYGAFLPIPRGQPPALWLARARQAAAWKDISEARRLFLQGAALCPQNVEFLHALGSVLVEEKRLEEAEKVFCYALTQHPKHAPLYHALGLALVQRASYTLAVEQFRKALQLDPVHKEAQRHLILAAGKCRVPSQPAPQRRNITAPASHR